MVGNTRGSRGPTRLSVASGLAGSVGASSPAVRKGRIGNDKRARFPRHLDSFSPDESKCHSNAVEVSQWAS